MTASSASSSAPALPRQEDRPWTRRWRRLTRRTRWLAAQSRRHQQLLSIVGLLLAQVLVVLLHGVLIEHMDSIRRAQELARQQAAAHQQCQSLHAGLARQQCELDRAGVELAVQSKSGIW